MKNGAPFIRGLMLAAVLLLAASPVRAAKLPLAEMNHILGRAGKTLPGGLVRYSWLRTDLKVTVHNFRVAPALCAESWATFMPAKDSTAIASGDLVLLQNEAPKVLAVLSVTHLTVTSMGSQLLNESPRLLYLHFVSKGKPIVLAGALRKALDATATPLKPASNSATEMPARWIDEIRSTIGYSGYYQNKVLSIRLARYEKVRMGGYLVAPDMGVGTWLRFQKLSSNKIVATGDFALVADELGRVIDTLAYGNVEITAINSPALDESPRLFFLHFWTVGQPLQVARKVRAALYRTKTGEPQ